MVRPSLSPLMTNPDERDVVVDIAGDHATEAAVQRWLTSPVMERKSIQGSSKYSEIQNFEYQGQSNETSRNRANPTAGVAKRGKCLVRERLKQKARMEQQNKASVGDIDSNSLCSSVSPSKSESSHKQIDIRGMAKEPGNITPSTAASTRSYSSKSFSVANSSAKLTISDSSASPVENPQWTPRSLNSTHAQHVRRSIEIPELDSSRYPRYPVPPKLSVYNTASQPSSPGSRLSSSSGSSSPRSTLSNKYPGITQSFGSNSTAGRSSSRQLTPVTSSSERYYSGPRLRQNKIVISRQSQCSQQDSDEEREKPDIATPQRAQTHSSDHRQQQTPCIGRSNRIKLHVYDLIAQETVMQLPWGCHFPIGQCFNALNSGLHTLGTGAYHVGIEINGIEYAYGANDTNGLTGVFTCMPRSSPGYQYRTTIDLGDRALMRNSQDARHKDGPSQRFVDGREIVREMATEYMGTDYDLLRKNCVTFAHDACLRLGVKESEVPEWFRNLCLAGAAAQDAANSTMAPLTRVFSSCDMEGLAEMVKDAGFEVINDDREGRSEQIIETQAACSKS